MNKDKLSKLKMSFSDVDIMFLKSYPTYTVTRLDTPSHLMFFRHLHVYVCSKQRSVK